MVKLTIFTPTYNRGNLLPILFESLKRQTYKEFVWLVIDDGSIDNTEELFTVWKKENPDFKIIYKKKANGGKHTAIEQANEVCTTDYIVCVDSDDYLTERAIEQMYNEIDIIDKMEDVCGAVTRRIKPNGEVFCGKWAPDKTLLYFNELYTKYGYKTDTCLLFKTNIVKNFHFPVFEDEKFVTESVYYNKFLYKYKMLASVNLYYVGEYMPDGYTAQGMKLFLKNPKGYAYSLKMETYLSIKNRKSFKKRLIASAHFYAWCKIMKLNTKKIANEYKLGIYGLFGRLLMFIPLKKYKKELEVYEQNKNNGK